MSIRTTLGLSRESLDEEGTPDEIDARKRKRVLDARIAAARANPNWREVEESALVRRPPNMLVDAGTGSALRVYRGEVWSPGTARVSFIDEKRMMWFLVRDDDLVILEYLGPWETRFAKRVAR
jgi:hypothetical protein